MLYRPSPSLSPHAVRWDDGTAAKDTENIVQRRIRTIPIEHRLFSHVTAKLGWRAFAELGISSHPSLSRQHGTGYAPTRLMGTPFCKNRLRMYGGI